MRDAEIDNRRKQGERKTKKLRIEEDRERE